MKYDFETVQPRRHVGSKKWDEMEQYGVDSPDVAERFRPYEIKENLNE